MVSFANAQTIKSETDKKEYFLGETITINIDIEYPDSQAYQSFEIDTSNGLLRVVELGEPVHESLEGLWRTSIELTILPLDTGLIETSAFLFLHGRASVRGKIGGFRIVDKAAITSEEELHPLEPMIEAKPEKNNSRVRIISLIALLFLLLAILAWLLLRKRKTSSALVRESPGERAIKALEHLTASRDLMEEKDAYARLSVIFRTYYQETTGFKALDRTGPEIVEELKKSMAIEHWNNFFERVRLAKYAKGSIGMANLEQDIDLVRSFVSKDMIKEEEDA